MGLPFSSKRAKRSAAASLRPFAVRERWSICCSAAVSFTVLPGLRASRAFFWRSANCAASPSATLSCCSTALRMGPGMVAPAATVAPAGSSISVDGWSLPCVRYVPYAVSVDMKMPAIA